MALFDIFTNKNAQDAAAAQQAGLLSGYNLASGDINAGIGSLSTGYGNALGAVGGNYNAALQAFLANQGAAGGAITSGYGSAADALRAGYGSAADALRAGYGGAAGALTGTAGQAAGALTGTYGAALQPFLQNYATARGGVGALTDALGITGDPAQLTARLQATPGYQFQLQQGNENILRNASRTGSLASGGTNVDLLKFGQGLADTTYQNYVQNLQPFLGASGTAASGIGNIYTGLGGALSGVYGGLGTGLANIYTGGAGALGNVYTGGAGALANTYTGGAGSLANIYNATGQGAANLYTGQGTALGNLYTGQGKDIYSAYGTLANLGYGTQTGIGNAQANADLANNQASANIWNAIMQGGKLAAGAGGGGALGAAGTGIWNAATKGFTPGQYYAEGGRPPVGEPSVVGERGPELFVPDRPGTIIPSKAWARKSTDPRGPVEKRRSHRSAIDQSYASKLAAFLEAA